MKILHRLRGEMETPRLLLRRWKPLDFQAFLRFAGDPEVMLPAGSRPAQGLQEAEIQFHRALRDEGCYAMVLKGTGEPIGKIKFQEDLRRFRVNSLSIGYELARAYWGRGLMAEALSAMVKEAFRRRGVEVLAISHFAQNQRSRRVIEKCGFRYEGTILRGFRRFDGQVFDDVCYSITREEYFAHPERYEVPVRNGKETDSNG